MIKLKKTKMKKIIITSTSLIVVLMLMITFLDFQNRISEQNIKLTTDSVDMDKNLPPVFNEAKKIPLIPSEEKDVLESHIPATNVSKYIYTHEEQPLNQPQPSQLKIIDKFLPLPNSASRSETDKVTHIVIHFISNVIAKPNNPYVLDDIINIFKKYGVSAHYLITRDGIIFRLVDEERNAFHAGKGSLADYPEYTDKLNHHSIGIELLAIGTEEEMKQYISSEIYRSIPKNYIGYTNEQYAALNLLLPEIYKRHGIKVDRRHVIGHDEYSAGRKEDPGSLFDWSKIGL